MFCCYCASTKGTTLEDKYDGAQLAAENAACAPRLGSLAGRSLQLTQNQARACRVALK